MKLIVTIKISELEYREAIVKGWKNRFNEIITIADVESLDNVDDFQWALSHISPDTIINIEVEK